MVARYAPVEKDAEVAGQAPDMTVSQLTRVLSKYKFTVEPEPVPAPLVETREVSFGADDDGIWRLRAALPLDEGAAIEAALVAAGTGSSMTPRTPTSAGEVCWADALGLLAERSQAEGARERPHSDRHRVLFHLEADPDRHGHQLRLHQGPVLPDSLRRYLLCDATIAPVITGQRGAGVGRPGPAQRPGPDPAAGRTPRRGLPGPGL